MISSSDYPLPHPQMTGGKKHHTVFVGLRSSASLKKPKKHKFADTMAL